MEKSLEKENYKQSVSAELIALKEKVKHNNEKDLLKNKTELTNELNRIIAGFYFHESGLVENTFKHDEELQTAITVLHDDNRYKQILAKR